MSKYKDLKKALAKDINDYTHEYVANLYSTGKRVAPLWNGFSSFTECFLNENVLEIEASTSIRIDIAKYLKDRFGIKKKAYSYGKGKYYDQGYVNYYQKIGYEGLTEQDFDIMSKYLKL